MRSTRWTPTALILIAVAAGPISPAHAARQGDPFQGMKAYDYQARKPIDAIRKQIQSSLGDRAALAGIEAQLVGVLKDPGATLAGKQEACKFLWIIGTSRSVPVLAQMLGSSATADMARYALERNMDPSAAAALRGALRTVRGKALVGVVNSIGDRGDPLAVAALKPLMASRDPLVAGAATAALGKIGTASALAALKSAPGKTLATWQAMLRAGGRMAAAGRPSDAERVYLDAAAVGRPSVARAAAVLALAAMRSTKAPAVALAALQSGDAYLQVVAARACGSMPERPVLAASTVAWPSLPAPAQTALLAAWSDRREPGAYTIARKAIGSGDPALRAAAIQAAARCGGANAVPVLAGLAAGGDGLARDALAGMPGREADEAIVRLAGSGEPAVRAALMSVLADRNTPAARGLLMQSARGADAAVAVAAIRALEGSGGAAELPDLVRILVTTPDDGVREAAQRAVVACAQRVGDRDRAAEPVLAALAGASTPAKRALIGVLAETGGDRALGEITAASRSADADIKAAAVAALADTWSDSRPLPTLLEIARTDASKSLRVQALRGYLRLVGQDEQMPAEQRVARVAEALAAAERPEEKRQALGVLRDCRVPAAVDLAAKSLENADLFEDGAATVLYLAAPQKKGDREQPAVTGPETTAVLDAVIRLAKSDDLKAQAQKLRQP